MRLGPIRPGDLARELAMDASTLTRNLQPLVAQGWVSVGPGDDGRSRCVAATDAGRVKRAEAQREWKRAQLAFNRRLGDEQGGTPARDDRRVHDEPRRDRVRGQGLIEGVSGTVRGTRSGRTDRGT